MSQLSSNARRKLREAVQDAKVLALVDLHHALKIEYNRVYLMASMNDQMRRGRLMGLNTAINTIEGEINRYAKAESVRDRATGPDEGEGLRGSGEAGGC